MRHVRRRFALAIGVWAAGAFAPAVAFAVGDPFDGTVRAVDAAAAGLLFALGAAGGVVAFERSADPLDRFRSGLELAGAMLVAGVELGAAVAVGLFVGFVAAIPFAVGAVVTFAAALLAGAVADRALVAQSRAATDEPLVWRGRKRPAPRWRRAASALTVAGAAVIAAVSVAQSEWFAAFVPLMAALSQLGVLLRGVRSRRYEVLNAGLVSWAGMVRWEGLDSYEVTDDALLLYGNVWPFGTLAFDRDSVENLDAVVDGLDRYLPRADGDHEDPNVFDNLRQAVGSG